MSIDWPMCACRDGFGHPPCPVHENITDERAKELDDILSEGFTQLQPRDVRDLRVVIMRFLCIASARREAFERGWDAALDSLSEQIEIGRERIANEPQAFRDLAMKLYLHGLENPLPKQRTETRTFSIKA